MLFAFAIFLISIFLFNLKVIVGTVVIEDMVISLREEVTVFINLRLDQVPFLCQDTECPVDIMKFVLWWFQKALRSQKGRTFTAWLQYPGVDQIGQDSIEIIFIVMPVTNLSADTVQAQLVINRLQEKITTLEFSFFTVRDFPVWMKDNRKAVVFFLLFKLFRFNPCLFLCPIHDIIPGRAVFQKQFVQGAKFAYGS